MACGTGIVFQSAKLVQDIGPRLGCGGTAVNARAACTSLASNPVCFAATGSWRVAIMFSLIAGSASTRFLRMERGSKKLAPPSKPSASAKDFAAGIFTTSPVVASSSASWHFRHRGSLHINSFSCEKNITHS